VPRSSFLGTHKSCLLAAEHYALLLIGLHALCSASSSLLQRLIVNDAKAQGVLLPGLGYASQLPPIRPSYNKRW
jgi:hypothetical protein